MENPGSDFEKKRRREPISLEELIENKNKIEAERQKPVFLTKSQRRELAIKQRQAEVEEIKKKESIKVAPKIDFPIYDSENLDRIEREKELELIRRDKLGLVERRKKVIKMSEKFSTKPSDWDLSDDTSQDTNSLYLNKMNVLPQFGRGYIAGIDPEEQVKKWRDQETNPKLKAEYDAQLKEIHKTEQSKMNNSIHWSEKSLADMTSRDWRIFREDYKITIKGGNIALPIRSWSESSLPDWLLKAIKEVRYKVPSPIQMQAIPISLKRRDLIGIAETGSGKTAAFLLPLLVHISELPQITTKTDSEGPYACILAPTRELAMQIKNEADKFSKFSNCRTALLIGGEDVREQISKLRNGAELIVATPGRLVDLLTNAWIVLNQCQYLVLDEGDRMIDLGFEDELLQILESMPQQPNSTLDQENNSSKKLRTTTLFSATMPPPIERIANKYLQHPAYIYIGEAGHTSEKIKQNVEWIKSEAEKRRRLKELLIWSKPPIIVFVNQKRNCDILAKFINSLGFASVVLHSGKSQDQREWAINEFKSGNAEILVATNVAGRGLDVKGVTHVINYDLPDNIEDYTHRIGRTGRMGTEGLATSFVGPADDKIMIPLRLLLLRTQQKIPKELLDHVASSGSRPMF